MGRNIVVVATVMIALIAPSCVKHHVNNTTPPISSTLVGRVVDKGGHGLVGVQVTSMPRGFSTNTIVNGEFTLPNMDAGDYQLFFHLVDYHDTTSDTVRLGLADTQYLDTTMKLTYRFGQVSGQVVSPQNTNQPLGSFAGIEVENQNVSKVSTTGIFTLRSTVSTPAGRGSMTVPS